MRPRAAAVPGFWHDNTQCHIGQYIAADQQQAGIGADTRHCPWCASLNEPLRKLCAPQAGVTVVQAHARCQPSAARSTRRLPLT